jgi:hypothetical protein
MGEIIQAQAEINWSDIFIYDEVTGNLLWKIDSPPNFVKGKIAGTINNTGYYRTKVFGKKYLNHRIIFAMHHGYMPKYIDHIDRNRLNNKIENLRPATRRLNAINREYKNSKNTASGLQGIYKIGDYLYVRTLQNILKRFDTEEQAREYKKNRDEMILNQELAKLN